MTVGSNPTAVSRTGIERNCHRQQKPRSEKICHYSQSRLKDQKYTTSPYIRTCLKLCFKDRVRMEQREPAGDPNVEGRLRELASKWFLDTQVPLIVNNGLFPTWFLGFITRKDAEEMLREKELGCFLIRLSDKALGYILSYKGRDRCRHFVINQSETGQFVVCGDTEGHDTVPDLIEHYKSSPIEPFGEYLTCSCFEAMDEELYDIIQLSPKEKPVVPLRSVNKTRQQVIPEQQPAPPPRSNRTSEEVPPLPRRSRHLDSSINDREKVLYAQLMKQSPRAQHNGPDSLPGRAERSTNKDQNVGRCSPPSGTETAYSELGLLECKSRSLPLLDNISDEEQPYRLSVPPDTPPRLSPRPGRQVASCAPQPEKKDKCSRPTSLNYSLDHMSDGAVYHLAGSPHTTPLNTRLSVPNQLDNSVYAEVSSEDPSGGFPPDGAYELVPNHKEAAKPKPNSNTYEPLEDIRRKHNSWGLKNDKWKWLFPEVKRKW